MELTVMTFNLRMNTASDGENAWPFRKGEAADAIRKAGAAVVGIQEGLHDMVTDLADQLPEYGWVGEGRQGGTNDEYCAIFYRKQDVSVRDVGHFALSETPERLGSLAWETACPRMCTWVALRLSSGQHLLVYNTHLDHRSQLARENGIALVVRHLEQQCRSIGAPALLMGDLNATPDNPVVRYLRGIDGVDGAVPRLQDAFLAAPEAADGGTFHGFTGKTDGPLIDYIFATPGVSFRQVRIDREQVRGRYPSDHFPVIATVQV